MSGASPGRGAIAAYVAAVVLGILGMHTLDQHCPIPVPGASHSGVAHADMHLDDVAGAAGSTVGSLPSAPLPGNAMLCAAMLLTALAGASVLWLLGRESGAALRARLPLRSLVRRACQVRATGPPPAISFVVLRC